MIQTSAENQYQNKLLTVPNMLSLFRLCLIPVIIWLYCAKKDVLLTACALLLSGVTDVADGFIARRFHMISNVGKALDPVADKLTQAAMLFCLVTRFRYMLVPLLLFAVKEITMGITGLMIIVKREEVYGAVWHGKATTVILYGTVIVHVIWYPIPSAVSVCLTAVCTAIMLLSFGLYLIRNFRLLAEEGGKSADGF